VTSKDIRWIQRLDNFKNAISQLKDAVELSKKRSLTPLEEQGLIQAFEFTHELAWKTLKDFLQDRGVFELFGSKDVTREAFKAGLIENGEAFMQMIESRNLTSHTYNKSQATMIVNSILSSYFIELMKLVQKLESLKTSEKSS